MLQNRSNEPELMDDLECQGEVVTQTLQEIDFINSTLGGNNVSISGIKKLAAQSHRKKFHIMDLGCGSGDLLMRSLKMLNHQGYAVHGTGIDANPYIIAHARKHCEAYPDIQFEALNIFSDAYRSKSCDILHASLFLHHFTRDELVDLFKLFKTQATTGMVISDLHRHTLAYWSIRLLTRLFSRSEMVKYDAVLSVKRGFRRTELKEILESAGIINFTIQWKWAFRWRIIIQFDNGGHV